MLKWRCCGKLETLKVLCSQFLRSRQNLAFRCPLKKKKCMSPLRRAGEGEVKHHKCVVSPLGSQQYLSLCQPEATATSAHQMLSHLLIQSSSILRGFIQTHFIQAISFYKEQCSSFLLAFFRSLYRVLEQLRVHNSKHPRTIVKARKPLSLKHY